MAEGTLVPAWEGLWDEDDEGAYLVGGRCGACGGLALGLRPICPHCHREGTLVAEAVGRRGCLYSATVIHQAPPGFEAPYRVGYVDIGEGLRVFAHVQAGQDAPGAGNAVALHIAAVKTAPDGQAQSGPFYAAAEGDAK
ncbi:MAG: hypothetical protein HOH66_15530 [Rhodospirillaceae bacterium]|jgi:uncharacterized protein|nr:hypothetical protein [Rhodospirillaceae bacterium]MBT6119273.1 hypothetical protein [Rhodospirillaceae bacterium]